MGAQREAALPGRGGRRDLVVQEHGATGLDLLLVYKGGDAHVVLDAHRGTDDGVVVIDDLLKGSDPHRGPAELVHLVLFLLVLYLARLQRLLVGEKLLLH